MPVMAKKTTHDAERDLELDDDPAYQRSEWRVQRVIWAVMALVLLLVALGFTGHGVMSTRHERSARGDLELEYEAFARHQAPTDLTVRVAPGADASVRIRLGRELVDNVDIQRIDPEPERVEAASQHYTFVLPRAPGHGIAARFHYRPTAIGPIEIDAALDGGSAITVTQFLYP